MNSFSCCPGLMRAAHVAGVAILIAGAWWLFVRDSAATEPHGTRFDLKEGSTATSTTYIEGGRYYGLLVSALDPTDFRAGDSILVSYTDPAGGTLTKTLHGGDFDLYMTVRASTTGTANVTLKSEGKFNGKPVRIETELAPIDGPTTKGAQLASALHTTWQTAEPIELGSTIYASGDDRPYIPGGATAEERFEEMLEGVHWYRFEHKGPEDVLAHINVEILDRDVPLDVALFTIKDGNPIEYTRGRERFDPERSTVLHGLYKFVPRVLEPGIYYVRVMGNHPAYQLQTDLYPLPPYKDAHQAIRAGMDYIVRKGDSWHANVPRRGVVALRNTNPVQETRLCIACHPTHFSTRSEMIAIENGYPVRARQSLQFLIERLYNNPRPIYGKTDASWARMIHAPGNVLSRLAYITNKFDRQITGDRREELYRGISEFLKLYWPNVETPQPESNGNLPRISGFEVAHHSGVLFGDLYEQTADPEWARLRDQTEQVVANGEAADMLDLAWQTVALVEFGREKYRDKIAANVDKIFSLQKSDGSWAMPFGMEIVEYDWSKHTLKKTKIPPRPGEDGPLASEFQTFHTIYALAKAGITLDDPRLKKAVDLCLSRQTASGAWQGAPEYKNFDTPFRDTQYALMALSTLFPGPNAGKNPKGWNAGHPVPPTEFDENNVAATVAALDQHWDRPSEATVTEIRKLLRSRHVLVRHQAAVALGRFADGGSLDALVERLGDRSKLVQRAAAWSLRQIASRKPAVRAESIAAIRKGLRSGDARVRWGAARVFNQHFKYISEEWDLGQELIRLATNEPVPAVKMAAVQGLYQWWFWDRNTGHKGEIELALIGGLGRDEHPWVRRNFIEAYYNVLDDNLRYLYGSWMPRVKRDEDREVIGRAHKENVRVQTVRYHAAMLSGNERMRDGLLRALSTHVLREGQGDVEALDRAKVPPTVAGPFVNGYKWFALHDPLTGGSGTRSGTGNDSDAPKYYEDSAPIMNDTLVTALTDGSPELIRQTLKALNFLKPFPIDSKLADRMLALVEAGPEAVRAEVAESAEDLLPGAEIHSPAIEKRLTGMIAKGNPQTLKVAAAILGANAQKKLAANAGIQNALTARLRDTQSGDPAFAHLAAMLAAMPGKRSQPEFAGLVAGALTSSNSASRRAAVTFLFSDASVMAVPGVKKAFDGFLATANSAGLTDALSVIGAFNYEKDAYRDVLDELRRLALAAIGHSDHTVRAAALTALRTVKLLQSDEAVLGRLQTLLADKNADVRNSALAYRASLDARAGREGYDTQQLLDYEYFKYNVEPILTTKAADGLACANCHANHTIFKLSEPDEFGVLTHAESRQNYSAATGVVNIADPESSLLLNKPTRRLDDEGVGDSVRFSHGGGLRWPDGKQSREYRTILRWIQGERLGSAHASAE